MGREKKWRNIEKMRKEKERKEKKIFEKKASKQGVKREEGK